MRSDTNWPSWRAKGILYGHEPERDLSGALSIWIRHVGPFWPYVLFVVRTLLSIFCFCFSPSVPAAWCRGVRGHILSFLFSFPCWVDHKQRNWPCKLSIVFISHIADGLQRCHPACGHQECSRLSPVQALHFLIAMQVFCTPYNSTTNGWFWLPLRTPE